MPSLIEQLCDRIQGAATPQAPTPFTRVAPAAVTAATPTGPIQRRVQMATGDTQLPPDMFKDVLDAEDRIPEKPRTGKAGYIHVSSLIGMCARAQVLSVMHGVEVHKAVTGGHRVMWKFGRAVEQHVRESIIRSKKFANVYGVWKCVCRRTEEVGYHNSARMCPTCKGKLDTYNELTLYDHEAGIVGNPDLLYRHSAPFVVVEVKSMTGEDWKALEAPLGDHIFQAGMYRHLLKKNNLPTFDEVVIFYTSKHFTHWGSPYKEFHVDVSRPEFEAIVNDAVELAKAVKAGNAQRIAPPRTACANNTCTRAKNCPAQNLCFQLP